MMNDLPQDPPRIAGARFVCEVPRALGAVTKLRTIGDRVIADTESGTPMIVPVPKKTAT